jgi:hypothetical protein
MSGIEVPVSLLVLKSLINRYIDNTRTVVKTASSGGAGSSGGGGSKSSSSSRATSPKVAQKKRVYATPSSIKLPLKKDTAKPAFLTASKPKPKPKPKSASAKTKTKSKK